MKGPTVAELLVKEVQERVKDQYRFRELAHKCENIQELREKLDEMLTEKRG